MIVFVIINNIVQAFIIFVTCLGFFNVRTNYKQKVVFSLLYGSMVVITRQLYNYFSLPFGVHTVVLTTAMILLFYYIVKDLLFVQSIGAALIAVTLLFISETFIIFPLINFFSISTVELFSNACLLTLGCIISDIFFIFMFVLYKNIFKEKFI